MSSNNNEEQRKRTRTEIDRHVTVEDALLKTNIGKLVNLHDDGFLVIGSSEVRENCLYQIYFRFSELVHGVDHLSVGAECLWLRETGSGDQHWAGFQIIDIADKDKHIIQRLMIDTALND